MKEFDDLMDVSNTLNSPGGCPWDLKQTFESLKPYVLEEAHEALEAVEQGNDDEIMEELGDLLYTVIFYAQVAKKEGRFSIQDVLKRLKDKLVRRHPHVFGDVKAETIEDVVKTWGEVKKEEKKDRKSPFDGIPKSLPALQKAQKVLKRLDKSLSEVTDFASRESELAHEVLSIVAKANEENIDMESALRKTLHEHMQ